MAIPIITEPISEKDKELLDLKAMSRALLVAAADATYTAPIVNEAVILEIARVLEQKEAQKAAVVTEVRSLIAKSDPFRTNPLTNYLLSLSDGDLLKVVELNLLAEFNTPQLGPAPMQTPLERALGEQRAAEALEREQAANLYNRWFGANSMFGLIPGYGWNIDPRLAAQNEIYLNNAFNRAGNMVTANAVGIALGADAALAYGGRALQIATTPFMPEAWGTLGSNLLGRFGVNVAAETLTPYAQAGLGTYFGYNALNNIMQGIKNRDLQRVGYGATDAAMTMPYLRGMQVGFSPETIRRVTTLGEAGLLGTGTALASNVADSDKKMNLDPLMWGVALPAAGYGLSKLYYRAYPVTKGTPELPARSELYGNTAVSAKELDELTQSSSDVYHSRRGARGQLFARSDPWGLLYTNVSMHPGLRFDPTTGKATLIGDAVAWKPEYADEYPEFLQSTVGQNLMARMPKGVSISQLGVPYHGSLDPALSVFFKPDGSIKSLEEFTGISFPKYALPTGEIRTVTTEPKRANYGTLEEFKLAKSAWDNWRAGAGSAYTSTGYSQMLLDYANNVLLARQWKAEEDFINEFDLAKIKYDAEKPNWESLKQDAVRYKEAKETFDAYKDTEAEANSRAKVLVEKNNKAAEDVVEEQFNRKKRAQKIIEGILGAGTIVGSTWAGINLYNYLTDDKPKAADTQLEQEEINALESLGISDISDYSVLGATNVNHSLNDTIDINKAIEVIKQIAKTQGLDSLNMANLDNLVNTNQISLETYRKILELDKNRNAGVR